MVLLLYSRIFKKNPIFDFCRNSNYVVRASNLFEIWKFTPVCSFIIVWDNFYSSYLTKNFKFPAIINSQFLKSDWALWLKWSSMINQVVRSKKKHSFSENKVVTINSFAEKVILSAFLIRKLLIVLEFISPLITKNNHQPCMIK